jgi:hypothetical protein
LNQIQERLLMGTKSSFVIPGRALVRRRMTVTTLHHLPQPGAAAALAFHHLVALFQETLAFAILALLLFLDVGTFVIGHDRKSPGDDVARDHDWEGRGLVYTRLGL